MYVWDARGAIHWDIMSELTLAGSSRNFINIRYVKQEFQIDSEYNSSGDIKHIENHPQVKRSMPKHTFYHS